MAAEKTRAVVIRAFPFGDTSSVVTLFTRDHGKLRALAKGAWRPKSSFDAALDLLSTCQVLVLRKSAGLDLVTEAFLERRFRVGRSQAAFLGGMHLAEMLDALTEEGDPQPELFDLATSVLSILSAPIIPGCDPHDVHRTRNDEANRRRGHDAAVHVSESRVRTLLTHAELVMLHLVGHGPAIDRCAECRAAVPQTGRFAFGMLDGGLLCGRCRRGKRAVVSISAECLAALRGLAAGGDRWRSHDLPHPVEGEVRAVMNTLLSHLLGRRPRVAPLLHSRRRPSAGPSRPAGPDESGAGSRRQS